MPHGTKDEWLFTQFKQKIEEKGKVSEDEKQEFVDQLGDILSEDSIFDAGL